MAPFEQLVTFLYTADLAATDRFYGGALGMPLALDQGVCRIYQVSEGGYVGFCTRLSAPGGPGGPPASPVVLTLATSQVDAWHAHLVAQGVPIERPPTLNAQFNIYHCFVRDPSGYLVEIQQFLDPAWPTAEEEDL